MRISSRRLLWGFNCLLIIAASLIFRPLRSWIDQTIIARAIHPDIKVQEVHFYPGQIEAGLSVVEAKQFDWSATHGNRSFGISADRAWMVVENESLVDKVVTIPKALLQQSKLYLENIPENRSIAANTTSTNGGHQGSIWQQQINGRFGQLEWNDLKQHFNGVLKLNTFASQCGSKIDAWVANTEKIAADAQLLGSDSDSFGNPLRDPIELRDRIAKLEALIAREKLLRTEMANVDSLVDRKLEEIGNQFDAHVGMAKEKAQQHKNDSKKQIASSLLEQTGGRVLSQFKAYAELADLICRSTVRKNGFTANEDYHAPGRVIFDMHNLMASGVFAAGDLRSPFRMQSQCNLTTKDLFGTVARLNFRYQFDSRPYTVKLVSSCRPEHPDFVDLQMEIVPLEQPAVDLAVPEQPDITIGSAQWVIGSNGSTIAGELCIDQRLLPFLAEGNPAVKNALSKHLKEIEQRGQTLACIVLEVGGTWQSPTWNFKSTEIPQWLEASIDAELDQQLRDNQQQMVAKLEEHVAAEIDKLSDDLQRRLDLAQKQTQRHTQNLMSIYTALNNKITSESNTEFARSSQEEVKR